MTIQSAAFLRSSANVAGCPAPDRPEYAFIGRSNVGKSSLINMLTGQKHLAKTSSTPGKTRLINHFLINETNNEKGWYLVDLPGYGYAKVSKKLRSEFAGIIFDYLRKRENLLCVFVLIDSRHKPQKNDLEFLHWLGTNAIPFVILFTKTDKLSTTELKRNISFYNKELRKQWEELPQEIFTSAEKGTGREEILSFVENTNPLFGPA